MIGFLFLFDWRHIQLHGQASSLWVTSGRAGNSHLSPSFVVFQASSQQAEEGDKWQGPGFQAPSVTAQAGGTARKSCWSYREGQGASRLETTLWIPPKAFLLPATAMRVGIETSTSLFKFSACSRCHFWGYNFDRRKLIMMQVQLLRDLEKTGN